MEKGRGEGADDEGYVEVLQAGKKESVSRPSARTDLEHGSAVAEEMSREPEPHREERAGTTGKQKYGTERSEHIYQDIGREEASSDSGSDRSSLIVTIILGIVLVAVLGIVGISIAIVVKVYENNDNDTTTAAPTTAPLVVEFTNKPIDHTDEKKYDAYKSAAERFAAIFDPQTDPCTDFYTFTCKNQLQPNTMSFDKIQNDDFQLMLTKINDSGYRSAQQSKPMQQLFTYFDTCMNTDLTQQHSNRTYILSKISEYKTATNLGFPLFDGSADGAMPNPTQLATAIGYLFGTHGLSTFLSPYVDTNWANPSNGYIFMIDEATLLRSKTYYTKLSNIKETLMNETRAFLKTLKPDVDVTVLESDIKDMVDMEYEIAVNHLASEADKRNYARMFNKLTLQEASDKYDFLDWPTLLKYSGVYGSDAVKAMMADSGYPLVLNEPLFVDYLGNVTKQNIFKPRTILNYFNLRLAYNYRDFVSELNTDKGAEELAPEGYIRPRIGRPRYLRMPRRQNRRKHSVGQQKDPADNSADCIQNLMYNFQYANARLFMDAKFPSDQDKTDLRKHIGQLANSIIAAFRGMVDQLAWMEGSTKTGAYSKMENLVRNIGYPDFVMDDGQLSQYYTTLTLPNDADLVTIERKLFEFDMAQMLNAINATTTARDDFNGPPGLVNAWYQPELNSITFPAAILGQPFYDPLWPDSVNYGAFGVVAGHELTHGFDDEGVQWDGVGRLYQWMGNASNVQFKDMANCVITEYDKFCPNLQDSPSLCVDGEQTQGENIADNGGIHAAYRAYKNMANLNGQDPAFDHPLLSKFTNDQLFFMGFAQVWCDPDYPIGTQRQLLIDPHSPSLYRVLGTIRNFPAFKNAFNCPDTTSYAPKPNDHCNVWVSDVDTFSGIPDKPQPDTEVNVPQAPSINRNDPRFTAYTQAAAFLKDSMNFKANPCTDFYEYSCGNYKKPVSFTVMRNNNYRIMADEMEKSSYNTTTMTSLQKTIAFYNKCIGVKQNYSGSIADGTALMAIMNAFTDSTTFKFSWLQPDAGNQTFTQQTLGKAIGLLSTFGVDTFITPMVDTDWKNPLKSKFFIDQNSLYYDKSYYKGDAWESTKDSYRTNIQNLFINYAALINQSSIPNDKYNDSINKIFDLELALARQYSTDETLRRQFERSYVQFYSGNYTFIDFPSYFAGLSSTYAGLQTYFNNAANTYLIIEPDMIKNLSVNFGTFDQDTIVNYMFFRLLAQYEDYLPTAAAPATVQLETQQAHFGRPRRQGLSLPKILHDVTLADRENCAYQTLATMQYANARIYVNAIYTDTTIRDNIQKGVSDMISNILTAYDGMVRQTLTNDTESIDGAIKKITGLKQNIAYPPRTLNDNELDAYYQNLIFTPDDTYFTMRQKLNDFNFYLNFRPLVDNLDVDRNDFNGPPGTVNAWYIPEYNSITFPAGILAQPFFDVNYPTSMNYGAMGVVAGHELSHGFDDEGVQWDGVGALNDWMKDQSKILFKKTAQCIIDEYHGFCPLNQTGLQPECLNGENTQGENIADNGGIHAAWNSYKNIAALHGADPQLPDPALGQLTHDQLFFLSFGQVWCQTQPTNDAIRKQILIDPHSPSKYRVLGTVQNFPAFRNAFNCPQESDADRLKHCSVWVPKM